MRRALHQRFLFHLVFLCVFWGAAFSTFLIQWYHLPLEAPPIQDPYRDDPLSYNPWDERMSLLESCIIWIGSFYGMLRLYTIIGIIKESDDEHRIETLINIVLFSDNG